MRTHQKGDAFIPLAADPFNQFKAGTKTHELRKQDKRWRSELYPIGRRVTLSHGYSGERLYGSVSSYESILGSYLSESDREAVVRHYGTTNIYVAVIGIDLAGSVLGKQTDYFSKEGPGPMRDFNISNCAPVTKQEHHAWQGHIDGPEITAAQSINLVCMGYLLNIAFGINQFALCICHSILNITHQVAPKALLQFLLVRLYRINKRFLIIKVTFFLVRQLIEFKAILVVPSQIIDDRKHVKSQGVINQDYKKKPPEPGFTPRLKRQIKGLGMCEIDHRDHGQHDHRYSGRHHIAAVLQGALCEALKLCNFIVDRHCAITRFEGGMVKCEASFPTSVCETPDQETGK